MVKTYTGHVFKELTLVLSKDTENINIKQAIFYYYIYIISDLDLI